jgi:hypothetical protein
VALPYCQKAPTIIIIIYVVGSCIFLQQQQETYKIINELTEMTLY